MMKTKKNILFFFYIYNLYFSLIERVLSYWFDGNMHQTRGEILFGFFLTVNIIFGSSFRDYNV